MHFATSADASAYACIQAPPAEMAVINTLLALKALPPDDRHYAQMDMIARAYLNSSVDDATARRRAYALLTIAGVVQ